MYRTCIFCSADLGTNDFIEEFPVGRSLAFDAWKGRLWAVCRKCGRWNLAPIEERWEAVESAEKQFRDSRLRVHSENIGLCKLPDGTRLIRVGEALAGELAAWRYGTELTRRRKKYFIVGTAVVVGVGGVFTAGFTGMLAAIGVSGGLAQLGLQAMSGTYKHRAGRRVVYRLDPERSPTGAAMTLRRYQLNSAILTASADGGLAVHLPHARAAERGTDDYGWKVWRSDPLVLEGHDARAILRKTLVETNRKGASGKHLDSALDMMTRLGGPEAYLRNVVARDVNLGLRDVPNFRAQMGGFREFGATFGRERAPRRLPFEGANSRARLRFGMNRYSGVKGLGVKLHRPDALALEMALHEDSERRALEGELAALEAAWREAEEIAAIADVLPDNPLDELRTPEPEQ